MELVVIGQDFLIGILYILLILSKNSRRRVFIKIYVEPGRFENLQLRINQWQTKRFQWIVSPVEAFKPMF